MKAGPSTWRSTARNESGRRVGSEPGGLEGTDMTSPTAEIITLKTRKIGTMNAIYLGPSCLVESEGKPGTWYVVENGRCTCPSGTFRGKCKHTSVAEMAAMIDENEAQPIE